jgi:hypothetical protein
VREHERDEQDPPVPPRRSPAVIQRGGHARLLYLAGGEARLPSTVARLLRGEPTQPVPWNIIACNANAKIVSPPRQALATSRARQQDCHGPQRPDDKGSPPHHSDPPRTRVAAASRDTPGQPREVDEHDREQQDRRAEQQGLHGQLIGARGTKRGCGHLSVSSARSAPFPHWNSDEGRHGAKFCYGVTHRDLPDVQRVVAGAGLAAGGRVIYSYGAGDCRDAGT